MSDGRQRLSVGFWVTIVLLLPVLYVASFGPACWLTARGFGSKDYAARAYAPLVRSTTPESVAGKLRWYAETASGDKYIFFELLMEHHPNSNERKSLLELIKVKRWLDRHADEPFRGCGMME